MNNAQTITKHNANMVKELFIYATKLEQARCSLQQGDLVVVLSIVFNEQKKCCSISYVFIRCTRPKMLTNLEYL